MIRELLAPMARADSTKSRCAKVRVLARATRTMVGMLTTARASPSLRMASGTVVGGPSTAKIAMSSTNAGSASTVSVSTPTTASTLPRK